MEQVRPTILELPPVMKINVAPGLKQKVYFISTLYRGIEKDLLYPTFFNRIGA
jgi:hypothetical protein